MSERLRRVAIYARVSTGGQTVANQVKELAEAAKRHGWRVVSVYKDAGISGAKGTEQRPALRDLMQAVARREVDIVMAWSVDRLGRSLKHLVGLLGELHAKGIDLYLHRQGIDTSTPGGKALYQMLGVFAELERSLISERVKAGHARARAEGKKIGRPRRNDLATITAIRGLRRRQFGIQKIGRRLGLGTSTVARLVAENNLTYPPRQ